MRPLKSIFTEPNQAQAQSNPAQAGEQRANRTAIRLAAQRWSRRQRQSLGILFLALLISLIVGGVWADRTGRLDVLTLKSRLWLENRLAIQGIAAPNVHVSGLGFTTHEDVRNALGAYDLEPLSRLNPHDTVQSLEALPWVSQARVQRLWPQTINIWITEKPPLALLHRGNRTFVIDGKGNIIVQALSDMAYDLPSVSGTGSEAEAPHLLEIVRSFPDISQRLVGATRLSERRWDLYLSPGVRVSLPADQALEGLRKLQTLMQEHDILERNIIALDLRGNRPIIQR